MSTLSFARPMTEKTRNATPGSSGTPATVILAIFASFTTPLMIIRSTFFTTSLTFVPGFRS